MLPCTALIQGSKGEAPLGVYAEEEGLVFF